MITTAKEFGIAEIMYPKNAQIKFWHAIKLINKGKKEEALPLFKTVFEMNRNWTLLIPRLRKVEILRCDDETEKMIIRKNA